jgi:hypothetical protein
MTKITALTSSPVIAIRAAHDPADENDNKFPIVPCIP